MSGDPVGSFDNWLREGLQKMFDDLHSRPSSDPPPEPAPVPDNPKGKGPLNGAGGVAVLPDVAREDGDASNERISKRPH